MTFRFRPLSIPDVILIEPANNGDARGFFREVFKFSEFTANGVSVGVAQINHSRSARGVLRGLHYQKHPRAQGKLLMVASGKIFDVAVDIRKGSPSYGKWVGETLTSETGCMLYVPPGFAHGFCVLSEYTDLVYMTTDEYAPELERGVRWNDPEIGVVWPIDEPNLSPRDTRLPLLREADNNFQFEPR